MDERPAIAGAPWIRLCFLYTSQIVPTLFDGVMIEVAGAREENANKTKHLKRSKKKKKKVDKFSGPIKSEIVYLTVVEVK